MKFEYFIAKRLVIERGRYTPVSRTINKIAIAGIALGVVVMVLAIAIVTGFKEEIRNKVIGFGSHIQIANFDSNSSYETAPIDRNQAFLPQLDTLAGLRHVQVYAIKAGIIKSETNIQGVVLKGVDRDFDWSFFKQSIVEGDTFTVKKGETVNKVIISRHLAEKLLLKAGDKLSMFFIQQPPRRRVFTISGIYDTGLQEFDKLYILGDIKHVQKLNDWERSQISGFELLIHDFDQIDHMAEAVFDIAGNHFKSDGSRLRVRSIKEITPQIFDWLELSNTNVWVILVIMVFVSGFNIISTLLIIILERTNMIGILKAMGARNKSIRRIFVYNATYLIINGLLWGNLIGIGLTLLQFYFGIIKLDPASYYVSTVPVNLEFIHIVLLNAGTLLITFLMLLIPSHFVARITPVKAIRFN